MLGLRDANRVLWSLTGSLARPAAVLWVYAWADRLVGTAVSVDQLAG
jgi:hypothetical protein